MEESMKPHASNALSLTSLTFAVLLPVIFSTSLLADESMVRREAIQTQSGVTKPDTDESSIAPLATQAGKVVDRQLRAAGWTAEDKSQLGLVRYISPGRNCGVDISSAHKYTYDEEEHFKGMKAMFTLFWSIEPSEPVHEYLMMDGTKMLASMFAGTGQNSYKTGNIWVAYKDGWAQQIVEFQSPNCTQNKEILTSVNAIRTIGGGER
jgi:hypothetical protein